MRFALAIVILFSSTAVALRKDAIVERIFPKGFRIKTSDNIIDDRIAYVIFNVNLNRSIEDETPTDFVALITDSIDGRWVYDNVNTRVKAGWKVSYRIDVFYDFDSHNNSRKPDRIISTDAEFPYYTIDTTTLMKEKCAKLYRLSEHCELSVTTVRGQAVCKGQRVFEDHFDELDPKVWKIDARIPWDTEDSPFLSYQNDPEVVFIKNGWLFFKPKFLSETPGFNESSLMTGTLKIKGCSGIGEECFRNARYSQILPPIISARIRSKHSFSFRYGKVVIGAQMPKGDWTMPMLFLEPLENYYGSSNYASGQIRIASVRGNRVLRTKNGLDISSRYLFGGVVLEDRGPLHDAMLRHFDSEERVSDEFHNFTLTWTEDSITLGMDDFQYARIDGGSMKLFSYKNANAWDSESPMAPFDREFYFSIGLSVGGHTGFPDFCWSGIGNNRVEKPWLNNDPKAMLKFWKDRQNWKWSWKNDEARFGVNFISVQAL